MLGKDDEEEEEQESGADAESEAEPEPSYDDGMDAFAQRAEGPSVTADRLRGNEERFADCRDAIEDDQQPHHLVPLVRGGNMLHATAKNGGKYDAATEVAAAEAGTVVLTEEALMVVVDGTTVCEVPYRGLQGSLLLDSRLELHGVGQVSYYVGFGPWIDDEELAAAYRYLRRMIRGTA